MPAANDRTGRCPVSYPAADQLTSSTPTTAIRYATVPGALSLRQRSDERGLARSGVAAVIGRVHGGNPGFQRPPAGFDGGPLGDRLSVMGWAGGRWPCTRPT